MDIAIARRVGYSEVEALRDVRWWLHRTHADDRELLGVFLEQAQTGARERWDLSYRFRRADGSWARGVAHDVNNLLSVARLNVELLQLDLAGEQVDTFGDLNDALDRATSLARRLLTLAYTEPVPARAIDVSELVRNFGRVASRLLGSNIAYTMSAEGPCCILADASQIEQVLLNLVVNSRDATSAGGRVTVTVSGLRLVAPKRYPHGMVRPGHWVCLRVTDTGHGIAADLLPRVFEENVTTNVNGANGFGLATVLGIVRTCRGHVLVESTAGIGTTVTCYFSAMPVAE